MVRDLHMHNLSDTSCEPKDVGVAQCGYGTGDEISICDRLVRRFCGAQASLGLGVHRSGGEQRHDAEQADD